MGGKLIKHAPLSRQEVWDIALEVTTWLGANVEVGGSYARGDTLIGDVDLLIEGNVEDFKDKLEKKWGNCKNGNPKRTGEINGVQVDLMFAPLEYYGASQLAIRGCGEFNVGMRSNAKKMGFKLSQYGLFKRDTDERVAGDTEMSIFEAMGMEYVKPEHRTGFDIVQKALKGSYKAWAIEESWWE